jgi:hypothetical protein
MVQAIAIASAMVAAVVGGLLAQSWIWAIACAIFVYSGFRVAAMFWVSHKIRTDPDWPFPHDAADDDDDDILGPTLNWDATDDSHVYASPGQDVHGPDDRDWSEDLHRMFGSHDAGRPAIEADPDV